MIAMVKKEPLKSRKFSRKIEDFICSVCGTKVKGNGYTDHCPKCLCGKHVDINPGDRGSDCNGIMEPIGTEYVRNGFIIHYRCRKCKMEKKMGAAPDDNAEMLEALLLKWQS